MVQICYLLHIFPICTVPETQPRRGKGASIKYVRKIFGILDPLPPLVRFSRNLSVLSYAKIGDFFNTPSPLARTYFMDAP